MLAGKRIVLGVTGGIAAYKAVELSRRLVEAGAHVIPVMTAGAKHFLGTTTLSALASEPVQTSLWDESAPIPHTSLGQSADLVVVAPATARLIGAYAAGLSTDLLTNVLLATRAPVIICPAMHTEMWEHPAVVDNIATLRRRGVHVVEPDEGRLAGGDLGKGRLAAPERILAAVERVLGGGSLADVHVVVTAGGTREPIDAVRVIANRSSGKQGYAVAAEALARGAAVTLVSTVELPPPPGADVRRVETAAEMQAELEELFASADVVVMAAAVADFRPKVAEAGKIKKDNGTPEIVLEPTPDILAGLGERKRAGQILVGFAAETSDVVANAQSKLRRKNLDLVVANDVSAPKVGFQHDTNAVTILSRTGSIKTVALTDKRSVARAILECVAELRSGVSSTSPPSTHSGAAQ
ncbi:MAG TPA: bifunctional phosphopantothenoylcysteine decarboxylase/phosphopantothenate--cysteine ligase CoaBC [Ilumatobacteraceae bacterium]|nr:bifunctional phosphopantothenoylcysteine decarboxylase/phosphopantothenate--cysteine ligase CoaBC [Ilumatobacteraceae bacterium]